MNYRRLALFVGILALGLSPIAAVSPDLVGFTLDWLLVSALGVIVLVGAVRVVRARWRAGLDEAATPDPELTVATPAPGDDFDGVLDGFLDSRDTSVRRGRVRNGLRSAAVAVLTRYGSYSDADAADAIANGTWTDDEYAAAFLGRNVESPASTSLFRRVVRGTPSRQRAIRRTVDAIADIAGVPGDPDGGREQSPPLRESTSGTATRSERSDPRPTTTRPDGGEAGDLEDVVVRGSHATGHWRGVSVVALVGIGLGALVERPAVLLAGIVGIGFAAYARSRALPPGSVSVTRTVSDDRPDPGDEIDVTLTATNESDRVRPDLRLVDGVPEAIAVADGSPRLGTALRPGESATISYTITARRGVHAFGPALLVARDLTGAVEQKRHLHAETTVTCLPTPQPIPDPVPLREQAARRVGPEVTASGGDGIEFHATRAYRSGDPMRRIDWNRRAKTGDLTTVEYRREAASTVVLVVDAREAASVSPTPHAPHAVDRAVEATGRLFATLADSGHRVGITAVSSESCWLAPNAGADHRADARELLGTHPVLSSTPGETVLATIRTRRRLRRRLSPGTQLLFLTPLCDDDAVRFARRLDERGYPVTVVSPDPTVARTASHRLSSVARTLRLSTLRRSGIQAIDWSWDDPIDVALARSDERWSR